MTGIGSDTILAVFVIFCRIGGCLMLMAGISSSRIPMQARLYLGIGITLAVAPMLLGKIQPLVPGNQPIPLIEMIAAELLTGALIGFLGRLFFLAFETLANAVAMIAGYGSMPGTPIDSNEPLPSMTTMITLTATLLLFVTNQHIEIIRALMNSYSVLPVSGRFDTQSALIQIADTLGIAFMLALRIASPFIIYGIIINLATGILNKMVPQIPVYFISMPFVIFGGLFLWYFTSTEFMLLFIRGFTSWLANA
jgi:flagellar biosynthetic protein FliR